jgi:hypothetical protein
MKTGTRLALGLGVGFWLASTARMWLALMVRVGGTGSGHDVRLGVLPLGALPEHGNLAEVEPAGEDSSLTRRHSPAALVGM